MRSLSHEADVSARVVTWLDRWKRAVLLTAALISVVAVFGLQRVQFDPDVLVYFSRDMPERKALEAIEDRFGLTNEVVFVLRARHGSILDETGLGAISFLHERVRTLPEVVATRSPISLMGEADTPPPGAGPAEIAARIRKAAAPGNGQAIVSADETVAAVAAIVPRNSRADIDITNVAVAARALQEQVQSRFPSVEVLLTGRLMMDTAFLTEGQQDTYDYAALQLGVLALVLLIAFRSLVAAAVLMAMVLAATLAMIGIVGWTGFTLNGISSAAPSVLLGLGVATGVHIVMAWQSALQRGMERRAAVAAALSANAVPVTLSVVTTLVSFLCLNLAASPPFRQLGNVVALGLVITLVMSFTVLPALLLAVPRIALPQAQPLSESMAALARFVIRRPRALLVVFAIATGGSVAGIAHITFDDTFSHYFDERFEIRRATDLFEEKLSGTIFVDFSVPASGVHGAFGREHLESLRAFSDWLLQRPEVADVVSLARVAREFAANAPPQLLDVAGLPETQQARAALQTGYQSARAQGLIGLVDEAQAFSRVNVILRGVSSADTLAFVRAAEARAAQIFNAPVLATGLPRLSAQLSLDSSRAMLISMAVTLAAVSLLLLVALRDVRLGAISLIPNLVPIAAAFGIWGFWVGEVSFAATVVGALTFGIVVDDTVHLLARYRVQRRRDGLAPAAAVEGTFRTVGVAVVITSVTLALSFAVFTFSGFLVNQHLGWLTAMTIMLALLADLLFLPPLLLWLDRR